jgi:outer membrane lipoprotein carrier protein
MRHSIFRIGIRLCAVLPLTALSVLAQSHTASDLAAKVDARYNHLASLRANFTEHFTGLNLDRTESGTVTMKKPCRMRWDYSTPTGKVFVLDGRNAWFYSPGDAQAQHVPAKTLDDLRSPMRYLLGHTHLDKDFAGLQATSIPGGYKLTGVPQGMAQSVLLVTLEITAEGQLLALRIQDTDGTTTEFRFINIQENLPLKDSDFLFTPPDGVPVVDAMPPI